MLNNAWVIPAMKRCMNTEGCCPTDCPGYEHCIGESGEIMEEGAAVLEQLVGRAQEMIEAMAGIRRVYLYFATKAPIDADKLPDEGYVAHVNHDERKYIRLIDDMAYGTAVYRRPLKPFELAALRLTSAPRD